MPTTDSTYPTLDRAALKRRWLTYGGGGLALVGAGFSVAADAGSRRASGAATPEWIARGTTGLVLLCAGLGVYGEAVLLRGALRRLSSV